MEYKCTLANPIVTGSTISYMGWNKQCCRCQCLRVETRNAKYMSKHIEFQLTLVADLPISKTTTMVIEGINIRNLKLMTLETFKGLEVATFSGIHNIKVTYDLLIDMMQDSL